MAAVYLIFPVLLSLCGAEIEPKKESYTASVGDDVQLTWIYDDENKMETVDWTFLPKNEITPISIMTQDAGKTSEILNDYNVVHSGNGNITLKSVTMESSGIYYCSVSYYLVYQLPPVIGTATLTVHATSSTLDVSSTSTTTVRPSSTTTATSTFSTSSSISTSTTPPVPTITISTHSSSTDFTTTTSSGNETTMIIVSSVVGGLFCVGIGISIVLMLLSQRQKHNRKDWHHDQDQRLKRPYNQGYPTWQEHGQYNNTYYEEYPGMGTKMNPLYTVPYRSSYRAERNYYLGHPSRDHQIYTRSHQIYHGYFNSNMRPQIGMHSYKQRYYGGRDGNNISNTLPRDENNYVTPDYELYW